MTICFLDLFFFAEINSDFNEIYHVQRETVNCWLLSKKFAINENFI